MAPALASSTRNCACISILPLTGSRSQAFLAVCPQQTIYSPADFLKRLFRWHARRGIRVERVQTGNGFEFTNRFLTGKQNRRTLFEITAAGLGIRHKFIRLYTSRRNGKVERSHGENQKRFCSLDDFASQPAVHNRRSNKFPMRSLNCLSPLVFAVHSV